LLVNARLIDNGDAADIFAKAVLTKRWTYIKGALNAQQEKL